MKKIICLLLLLAAVIASIPVHAETEPRQYEIWEKSPEITCGVTAQRINIWKAMSNGIFEAYRLDRLGSNYYLGIIHDERSDGGKNGNKDMQYLTYYILLASEDDFIILDEMSLYNEYYQTNELGIMDISDQIDRTFYIANKSEQPYYVINPGGYITWSDATYYKEYVFVTDQAKLYRQQELATRSTEGTVMLKDGVLYNTHGSYLSGTTRKYYMIDGKYATRVQGIVFRNKSMSYASSELVLTTEVTPENGYLVIEDQSQFLIHPEIYYPIPEVAVPEESDWFGKEKTNVFPDGRYATAEWSIGASDQELYFSTYKQDGTVLSTTRSGWLRNSYEETDIFCYPVSNTKLIIALGRMQNKYYYEYYRVGVVNETEAGEISGLGGGNGKKNLTPPDISDTEPVEQSIDFDKTNLPIGFNIKENIVGDNKLSPELREQINAIRLNDIVILKKEGYVSGTQNAGISLKSFSQYDYAMGNTSVCIYSNGQNFNWYCTEPNKLLAGTYNRSYNIGDKCVYVTFKVIDPPDNNGVTTVVF